MPITAIPSPTARASPSCANWASERLSQPTGISPRLVFGPCCRFHDQEGVVETIPLSLLNDFLFCPRRAALKEIEGIRSENKHTVLGELAHEHADLQGYE